MEDWFGSGDSSGIPGDVWERKIIKLGTLQSCPDQDLYHQRLPKCIEIEL